MHNGYLIHGGRNAKTGLVLLLVFMVPALLLINSCSLKKTQEVLRFGIMPDVDSMPFLAAKSHGLFEKHEVNVELVSFSNAQERDAAFQAGRLDGTISDLLAAVLLASGGFDIKVTSATDGRYGIALAPGSVVSSVKELQGKKIGLSTNTIIQYSIDAIAKSAGLEANTYIPMVIPKMPVRMELLLSGQVDAAGLPEPFLSMAELRGSRILATSSEYGLDAAVVLFDKAYLDKNLSKVKRLYKAYAEAAEDINAYPASYRTFLVEKAAFPEEVARLFRFVDYREPILPSMDQLKAVIAWLSGRSLLSRPVDAASLMDDRAIGK
ncbi:MetQ/NlpA family ABC transporter substrate-binding protein [Spirochaetota bacterium]